MPYVDGHLVPEAEHGATDSCVRCGHEIRLQTILFAHPVEPTWLSDRDGSMQCLQKGVAHKPSEYAPAPLGR